MSLGDPWRARRALRKTNLLIDEETATRRLLRPASLWVYLVFAMMPVLLAWRSIVGDWGQVREVGKGDVVTLLVADALFAILLVGIGIDRYVAPLLLRKGKVQCAVTLRLAFRPMFLSAMVLCFVLCGDGESGLLHGSGAGYFTYSLLLMGIAGVTIPFWTCAPKLWSKLRNVQDSLIAAVEQACGNTPKGTA